MKLDRRLAKTVIAGCFGCESEEAKWFGVNAQAVAAKHAKDYPGHETWVNITLDWTYVLEVASDLPGKQKHLKFYDAATCATMAYVYPGQGDWSGWLFRLHRNGKDWVSIRRANKDDLERINQAVVEAHHT